MSGQSELGESDRSAILRRAWELALHMLAGKVTKVTFETYIRPAQPLSYNDGCVTLGVASAFAREWLEKKAASAIRTALTFHLDTEITIQFCVLSKDQQRQLETAARKPDATRVSAESQPQLPLEDERDGTDANALRQIHSKSRGVGHTNVTPVPSLPINPDYNFRSFIVGRSNRLAHAGAVQASERPGAVYNPLFLYGGPGLGKTHLLQGIAHSLRITQPNLRVAYVSGEYFAQQYITSIRERKTEEFRRLYREVDVWLVDDIQFIAGKEHTKEEFFYTFNSLYQGNRQVVIASDRSPRDLNTMDERLRSRFQSGLIADIGAPDLETRLAILQQRRDRNNDDVPDNVLMYIANAIQSNVRALEGALTKLLAYSSIMKQPVSEDLAQGVLSEYFIEGPVRVSRVSVDDIIAAVARQFKTTSDAVKGPSRHKEVSLARHVAMYICTELLPEASTRLIGKEFGNRDHTAIVYACRRLKALLSENSSLQSTVSQITHSFGAK